MSQRTNVWTKVITETAALAISIVEPIAPGALAVADLDGTRDLVREPWPGGIVAAMSRHRQ